MKLLASFLILIFFVIVSLSMGGKPTQTRPEPFDEAPIAKPVMQKIPKKEVKEKEHKTEKKIVEDAEEEEEYEEPDYDQEDVEQAIQEYRQRNNQFEKFKEDQDLEIDRD